MATVQNVVEPLGPEITNGAAAQIEFEQPYAVKVIVEGSAPFLFHRWSNESVEAKSKAAKGSKAKKSDDLESYVYRDEAGKLCIPGEYFRMAIVNAAKFKQDPRSPRKSAMDLFKAGIAVLDEHCTLMTPVRAGSDRASLAEARPGEEWQGMEPVDTWDYLDRRRVMIQRNGVTRERPAMRTGWKVTVTLQCLLPEYISSQLLNEVVQAAGRLVGVGDFRPTYGRYNVTRFDVLA